MGFQRDRWDIFLVSDPDTILKHFLRRPTSTSPTTMRRVMTGPPTWLDLLCPSSSAGKPKLSAVSYTVANLNSQDLIAVVIE
jgi:hypothetical protein